MLVNENNRVLDIDDFAKALETVFQGTATILDRMRLSCTFYDHESGKTETDDVGQSIYCLARLPITVLNLSQWNNSMAGDERGSFTSWFKSTPEYDRHFC
jgi:hypothetical protein